MELALFECRQASEKELKWNRTTRSPCVLVVFGFGKRQVEEFGASPVSFPHQPISHATRRFVVVARPTAIKVNPKLSFWFRGNAIE